MRVRVGEREGEKRGERRGLHERVDGPHREIFFVFFWRF